MVNWAPAALANFPDAAFTAPDNSRRMPFGLPPPKVYSVTMKVVRSLRV